MPVQTKKENLKYKEKLYTTKKHGTRERNLLKDIFDQTTIQNLHTGRSRKVKSSRAGAFFGPCFISFMGLLEHFHINCSC